MEFDKSRVYTAVNADELEVGSMVIVADSLDILRNKVLYEDEDLISKLTRVEDETYPERFCVNGVDWMLAYLVTPAENQRTPKYKPFSNTETAYKTIAAHGGWVKQGRTYYFVTGLDIGCDDGNEIQLHECWFSALFVCENFIFADDGTPVGEKVEDCDIEEDSSNE